MKYRKTWNEQYATHQQGLSDNAGKSDVDRYVAVYSWYFRNWLPEDRTSPILEVGCGAGDFLRFLKYKGYENLAGLDSSPEQVAVSRAQGLNIHQGDALELIGNETKSFQTIVALDFIEHLTRDEMMEFLSLAWKTLEPGGRLILQTPNGESPWVGSVFNGDLTHEFCYTPHLLEKVLLSQGFRSIRYRPCGPPPTDFISSLRKLIWDCITVVCRLLNKIEGAVTSGVYTRVFLISALKPE